MQGFLLLEAEENRAISGRRFILIDAEDVKFQWLLGQVQAIETLSPTSLREAVYEARGGAVKVLSQVPGKMKVHGDWAWEDEVLGLLTDSGYLWVEMEYENVPRGLMFDEVQLRMSRGEPLRIEVLGGGMVLYSANLPEEV